MTIRSTLRWDLRAARLYGSVAKECIACAAYAVAHLFRAGHVGRLDRRQHGFDENRSRRRQPAVIIRFIGLQHAICSLGGSTMPQRRFRSSRRTLTSPVNVIQSNASRNVPCDDARRNTRQRPRVHDGTSRCDRDVLAQSAFAGHDLAIGLEVRSAKRYCAARRLLDSIRSAARQ